eukprot:764229-Pyramimonas_sp.AAC.1
MSILEGCMKSQPMSRPSAGLSVARWRAACSGECLRCRTRRSRPRALRGSGRRGPSWRGCPCSCRATSGPRRRRQAVSTAPMPSSAGFPLPIATLTFGRW